MESNNNRLPDAQVEKLLEVYFEGETTLAEEAQLKSYFGSGSPAPHLEMYVPLFASFAEAKGELLNKEITLPKKPAFIKSWWYGVAAMLVIAVSVAAFQFSQTSMTQEERDALAAFNKSREAMLFLSQNLNEGTSELVHIDKFTNAKNKILK